MNVNVLIKNHYNTFNKKDVHCLMPIFSKLLWTANKVVSNSVQIFSLFYLQIQLLLDIFLQVVKFLSQRSATSG